MTISQPAFEVKWKQMRDQIRGWWVQLSDNDLDRVAGRYEQFISLLQEKYGYTRPQAEEEVSRRMEPRAAREQDKADREARMTVTAVGH